MQREFTDYLRCGRLEHGFLRVRCESCHAEHLVAFSCKRRGFCPSCGARRMAESAALLVDEVLPAVPMRQWVLSFPFPLRFLFASRPKIMGKVLGIVYRVLATHLIHKAGFTHATARTGADTGSKRDADLHSARAIGVSPKKRAAATPTMRSVCLVAFIIKPLRGQQAFQSPQHPTLNQR